MDLQKTLSFALVAASWFARDQVAVILDKDSQDLQAALIETAAQQQAQQQSIEQREVLTRLHAIESRVAAKSDAEGDKAAAGVEMDALADDAEALEGRADTLRKLETKLRGGNKGKEIETAAAKAEEVAKQLGAHDSAPTAALWHAWTLADEGLTHAYTQLAAEAGDDCKKAQTNADWARKIAWICTGLGGLVASGFKLGGNGDAKAADAANPADSGDNSVP